jgi:hypothetical protein
MTFTCDCIYNFNVLLRMGAETTRNLYSNFTVNNKDDCLKLHHVGYLINRVMTDGTTNIKYYSSMLCFEYQNITNICSGKRNIYSLISFNKTGSVYIA